MTALEFIPCRHCGTQTITGDCGKHRSGKRSRQKGARVERSIADLLGARKVSRSGYTGPDLELPDGRTVEVKARADGFRQLYRWLQDSNMLVVKADRREPLVVLPLTEYLDILDETRRHRP